MESNPAVIGDVQPSSSSKSSKQTKDEHSRGSRSSRTRRERGDAESSKREDDRLNHSGRSSGRRERGDTDSSKRKEEDRLSRSERREKEEREAKRKARSSNDDASSSAPGAHSSTGEHHSSRKSGTRSSADSNHRSRSPKSPKRDEKSAHRRTRADGSIVGPDARADEHSSRQSDEKSAYRSTGSASVPGAQTERSSSRPSKIDEKGKGRHGTPATKPGAKASTSASDKSQSKSHVAAGPSKASNNEDEALVAATIVEEEEEKEEEVDVKLEPEQTSRASPTIEAAETARRERQLEADNRRLRDEIETLKTERNELERKAKKRNVASCIAFFLVFIWAAVATYFAAQGQSSSDAVNLRASRETHAPSMSVSISPSLDSISYPSTAPSVLQLKYPEPSLGECELIAKGLKIPGEDKMFDRSFAIPMEVTLASGNDIDNMLTDLEIAIEKYLVPDLIGCPRYLFQLRRLGHLASMKGNTSVSMWSSHRHLEGVLGIRFVIAKAIVDVTVTDHACEKSSSLNCSVVTANMVVKIRGVEESFLIAGVIGLVFPVGKDVQQDLALGTPFGTIVVVDIQSADTTPAPTIASTNIASVNPSGLPSYSSSTSPTSAPAIGPTTPAPTSSPSKSPSQTPSSWPSLAPTPTPLPSAAPQPGPTLAPTRVPTKSPSSSPSKFPSGSPSTNPTPAPSDIPSSEPSLASSSSPTIDASATPSSAPTNAPRLGFVPLLRQGMYSEMSSDCGHAGCESPRGLDGDYATIFHTAAGSNQWWRVQVSDYYGQSVIVTKVTVWNRPDTCLPLADCRARIAGATVKLFGEGDTLLATSSPVTAALVQTVDFGEVSGVEWIQVIQESKFEFLHFAEIEAWGNVPNDLNLLGYSGLLQQGMVAEQSSTVWNGGPANSTLDGDLTTVFHTDFGINQWWRVLVSDYYGQSVTVNKVTLWNRQDDCSVYGADCQARLAGATVKLFGEGDTLLATSSALTAALVQSVDFGEVTGVEWVQVIQESRIQWLHFAEIEAWGKVQYN